MSNGTFLHSRFRDYERFFCNLLCCLLCISCHIQSSDPWILIEASLGKGASITFESKWGTQSWRNAVPIRVGPKFNSIYVCLFVWFRVQAKRTWIHAHKDGCTVFPKALAITFESKWGTQLRWNAMPIRVGPKFKKVMTFQKGLFVWFRVQVQMTWIYGQKEACTVIPETLAMEHQSLLKVNEELNCDGMLCPTGWP